MPATRPRLLRVVFACFAVAFALLWACVRVNAQSACETALSSIYVLQTDADVSPEGVALANEWALDSTRYTEAVGRPEYTLYGNLSASKAERQIWLIYPTRADADAVVVMRFTYERMFVEGSSHPDCRSGTLARADLDAVLGSE